MNHTTKVVLALIVSASGVCFADCGSDLNGTGIKRVRAYKKRIQWTREDVLRALKALHEAGFQINPKSLQNNELPAEATGVITAAIGVEATPKAVYRAAMNRFDTFRDALLAAGLKPSDGMKAVVWENVDYSMILLRLRSAEIPLNSKSITETSEPRVTEVLSAALSMKVTGASFRFAAARKFGTWDKFLEAHGYSPGKIRLNFASSTGRPAIAAAIRALAEKKLSLAAQDVRNGGAEYERVIFNALGMSISGAALIDRAMLRFRSWPEARRVSRVVFKRDELVAMLKHLSQAQFDLHKTPFIEASDRVEELIYNQFGVSLGSLQFMKALNLYFANWTEALKSIGPRTKSNLPLIPVQTFYETDSSGESRKVKHIGQAPATPEEELLNADRREQIEHAVGDLPSRQQILTQGLVSYLEEEADLSDHKKVIGFLSDEFDIVATWQEIEALFEQLSTRIPNEFED